MDLNEAVRNACGGDVYIENRVPLAGGDINRAYRLDLSDGSRVFMKENSRKNADLFRAEILGLEAMRETGAVKVPEVLGSGIDGGSSFLLLEYIESGRGSKESSEKLGVSLAKMHSAEAKDLSGGKKFGFTEDNYIGSGKQINTSEDKWKDFFIDHRLRPQLERASRYFDREDQKDIDTLLNNAGKYLTEPDHPSLIHGDLWGGNYMIDKDGEPWLIDPAVYVGHAEADFAMTELFGGFDRAFYDAYRDAAGIDPEYEDRRDLYNLYHLLNHLNLFGWGYLGSVLSVIRKYTN